MIAMIFPAVWFQIPGSITAGLDPRSLAAPVQQAAHQAGQQAWELVPSGTKALLQQQASQGRQGLTQAKTLLTDQAAQRSEQAQQGLQGLRGWGEQVSTGATALVQRVEALLSQPVQQWLVEHQVMVWAARHPVWAAIALLFLAVLALNLLRILLNPRNWLRLLSWPLGLAQVGLASDPEPLSLEQRLQPGEIRQSEVNAVLRRLEALNKEQEILHGQLKNLLGEQDPKP